MKRLSQAILILGFLGQGLSAHAAEHLFWGIEEGFLCPGTLSEQVSERAAMAHYHELLTENLLMSPETRIEAYRRFTRLRKKLAKAGDSIAAELPKFAVDDLYETMLRVEKYRDRRDALLENTRLQFAELLAAFPTGYAQSDSANANAWKELVRLVDAAPNANELFLFDDHDVYEIIDGREMRTTTDQIARGKLMVAPPEILLWIETIHGLIVLEKSGVLEDVSDIRNLRLRWMHSLLDAFDKNLKTLTHSRLLQQVFLDFGAEFENLAELRHLVLSHIMASPHPNLLELQQHFISLLLIEDTRGSNLNTLTPKWSESLVPRESAVLRNAVTDFARLEMEIRRVLKASRDQLGTTHRGELPNIFWNLEGLTYAEKRINEILGTP
ncbi:MAG: hypothetical protein H6617_06040 [Bdellovibrionaceae bacterium]|nr:hypothetical protein [Pseudobdellovibrionaceae bacterium]